MKDLKNIDRTHQNDRDVVMTDVPKSGFNLTYSTHVGGLVLGRIYPITYQHCMPADKISGSNEASLIFDRLSTPVIGDVDICQHNFLTTLRSIDTQWEKFMTPTKLNNMNQSVTVPTFNLHSIIVDYLKYLLNELISLDISDYECTISLLPFYDDTSWNALTANLWKNVYHSDSLLDWRKQIMAHLSGKTSITFSMNTTEDDPEWADLFVFMCDVFDFFVGKRSLLDYFGYPMVSHDDIKKLCKFLILLSGNDNLQGTSDYLIDLVVTYDDNPDKPATFIQYTYPDCNEYALRAYYAIWFEYYRNFDLEPRSTTLPEYHNFGVNSIFYNNAVGVMHANTLHFLVPRIRSWQTDAFISAGIDDISRHVFAPVVSDSTFRLDDSTDLTPDNVIANRMVEQNITWRNPATGSVNTLNVTLPSNVLYQFIGATSITSSDYSLELFSLKKAQMLENFLKRIYYGGDEYRDRMLSLYGARIEDYRINRPKWLSSSLDSASPRQEVANTGVSATSTDPDSTPIGTRIATATAVASGSDGFTDFCPEFGIYVGMLSIMPRVTYDPTCYQNLQKRYTDFPIPQFANQMEDNYLVCELSRASRSGVPFGFAPYGHAYRYRVDEVHGDYLDEKFDYVFSRFFGSDPYNLPVLNWMFIHCRPELPMFVNSVLLDGQVYGDFKHNFLVERTLPVPVETI